MKLFKNTIISLILTFVLLEISSLIYFKLISNDKENLNNYINKREATDQYKYFSDIGLVLPKPNISVYHYTNEFVDKFRTKDILNNGVGFFDDGIDDKKIKAVAIGDSFTRGVGSIDNLQNGWVELVERQSEELDIVNLGNLGIGINDQKYGYNQLQNLINHDLILYNFYSGADFTDNLDDKVFSYYIKKRSKDLNKIELQEMIKDFNKRHGYKHYLEYLKDTKYRSYSVYFILKIADFLNMKKIINTYSFKYKLPDSEARLNTVNDELYKYLKKSKSIRRCIGEKYCVTENKIYEDKELSNKIVKNTSDKINQFYYEAIKNKKQFILIIHPASKHFYPNKTNINYNKLNEKMIQYLDKKIKIINLKKDLKKLHKKDPSLKIFYKHDPHYTIEGYKLVSEIILRDLKFFIP